MSQESESNESDQSHSPADDEAGDLDADHRRVRWQCRRGTLELDVWLREFVDTRYRQLDRSRRKLFAALLAEGDDALIGWLQGGQRPPEEFCEIVEWIRASRGHLP